MGDIHFDDGTPWHALALVGGGGGIVLPVGEWEVRGR